MVHEPGYELVDVGDAARLEQFGGRLIDRPSPAALGARTRPASWAGADLRYDRDTGWSGPAAPADPWQVDVAGLTLELRTTDAGQVGLFPEHLSQVDWLRDRVAGTAPPLSVLHLFAYTGLLTLALASAGASVTHVDSSRPTVAWARHNATVAGLAERPVRWIVDDARAFVLREARRRRRYGGVILDPPSYGHGPGSAAWRIEDDLDDLLRACASILAPGGFVLVTAHSPGFGPERLRHGLASACDRTGTSIDAGELSVTATDGPTLELGAFARSPGRAS
jgi:23S rRNA (cytosine1962-C5)-methyltransferase